jgi:hypothetical protein
MGVDRVLERGLLGELALMPYGMVSRSKVGNKRCRSQGPTAKSMEIRGARRFLFTSIVQVTVHIIYIQLLVRWLLGLNAIFKLAGYLMMKKALSKGRVASEAIQI